MFCNICNNVIQNIYQKKKHIKKKICKTTKSTNLNNLYMIIYYKIEMLRIMN